MSWLGPNSPHRKIKQQIVQTLVHHTKSKIFIYYMCLQHNQGALPPSPPWPSPPSSGRGSEFLAASSTASVGTLETMISALALAAWLRTASSSADRALGTPRLIASRSRFS